MKLQPKNKQMTEEQRAEAIKLDKIAKGEIPDVEQTVDGLKSVSSALIGGEQVDDVTAAKQLHKALCLFANTLAEEDALMVAAVFPQWVEGVKYKKDEYVRHGLNQDGEPQVYRVLTAHTSQSDWTPDVAQSLFVKKGYAEDGTPMWVQPMGAHDAYEEGDIVSYKNDKYTSQIDGNVWAPDVKGWLKNGTAPSSTTK